MTQCFTLYCSKCERTWISVTGFKSRKCPKCPARPRLTDEQKAELKREYQRNLRPEQRARKTERQRERRREKASDA